MAGELIRWFGTSPAYRQQYRELDAIERAAELAEAQVTAVNQVTQRALFETMRTQAVRQQAERIAPEGAPFYEAIALAGAIESARVVEGLNRRRYGR
jgi:hypothetical protein